MDQARRPTHRAALAALALAAAGTAARADPGPVRLDYHAAPDCPGPAALRAAVVESLGRDPFGEGGGRVMTVTVSPARATVTLRGGDGFVGERIVAAAGDCDELVRAAGFTAALALDPLAAPPRRAAPAARPAPPRRAVDATRADGMSGDAAPVAGPASGRQARDGSPADGTPANAKRSDAKRSDAKRSDATPRDATPIDSTPTAAPPTAAPPTAAPPTAAPPTAAPPTAAPPTDATSPAATPSDATRSDATRSDATPSDATPPDATAPPDRSAPPSPTLTAALGGGAGLHPGPGLHLDAAARLPAAGWRFELGARLDAGRGALGDGVVQSLYVGALTTACHPLGPLEPCLGALAGWHAHRGDGYASDGAADAFTLTGLARVGWPIALGGVTLTPRAELLVPATRTTLTIDGAAAWETPPAAFTLGIGVR